MKQPLGLAGILTSSRIVLAPVFILLFCLGHPEKWGAWALWVALGVAVAFELTDLLDGYIAHRRDQVSDLGRLLDPFADTVSRFSVFLSFLACGLIPVWMVAVLFYRDMWVAYLRSYSASRGVVVAARLTGKVKAWLQALAILVSLSAICAQRSGWVTLSPAVTTEIVWWAVLVCVIWTAYSGIDYSLALWGQVFGRKGAGE